MPDPMTPYDFVVASGLDAGKFATKAWAPAIGDKPALVSGLYRGRYSALIRAWPIAEGAEWVAQAIISGHPQLVFEELEPEESERLRAESQAPVGYNAPVGQEQVVGRSEPKLPYAPQVQPLDTAESVQADADGNVTISPPAATATGEAQIEQPPISEVTVVPLDCGPHCVRMDGPQGVIENHAADCKHKDD